MKRKKTHRHKGCGWLASRRDSKYKKTHIVAKDVVGLVVGDSQNDSLSIYQYYKRLNVVVVVVGVGVGVHRKQ